ncbi:MAG: hypothetical protein K2K68_08210, partial [Duncaniella sp.]|nr:hypothetical protein [Duncaniella sp.]
GKSMSPDWHDRDESVTLFNSALLSSLVSDDDRIRDEQHNDPVNRRRRRWTRWIIFGVVVALIIGVVAVLLSLNE